MQEAMVEHSQGTTTVSQSICPMGGLLEGHINIEVSAHFLSNKMEVRYSTKATITCSSHLTLPLEPQVIRKTK